MKLDKEFVQKNLFWLLLAGAVTLWLVSLVLVFLGPLSTAAEAAEDFKKETEKLDRDPKPIMNANFLPPWQAREKYFRGHKNTVWEEAWEMQGNYMTWPGELSRVMAKARFGDKFENPDQLQSYRNQLYKSQFPS